MQTSRIEAVARELYDAKDPIGGLRSRGFTLTREQSTESTVVERSGYPVSTSTLYFIRHCWDLRSAPQVQGELVREIFKHRLVKVFKSEIQVGDAAFDDAVYISTDTPKTMAAMLGCVELRAAIGAIVRAGGSVRVESSTVTVEIVDAESPHAEPEPALEGIIVAHVAATIPAD